jgi:outer membrane protein assembly factor BamD (BamD/ComL family)
MGWLVTHLSAEELRGAMTDVVTGSTDIASTCRALAREFETMGQWAPMEIFMNVLLDHSQDAVTAAKAVDEGLSKDGTWKSQYAAYCSTEPRLAEYMVDKQVMFAQDSVSWKLYEQSARIYAEILDQHPDTPRKTEIEFALCRSLHVAGKYSDAISKADAFAEQHRASHRSMTVQVLIIKGQSQIQLGQIDQACQTFLTVSTEYPDATEAAEANFFLGHGRMMQGRFQEAKEAFKILAAEYPGNYYSAQAGEYITKIDSMGE